MGCWPVGAFSSEGVDPGVFAVYFACAPEVVDRAISGVLAELARLRDEPVSAAELEQARKYLLGSYEISLQTNTSQGDELAFNTGKNTAKGRALARDPRVVMCVDEPRPPYSFVQVQGTAVIGEDPQDVLDIATRPGGRYMGAEQAEEYGRRNGVPGELVVRIKPTKVLKSFNVAE